jgi:hypothetical protein
MSASITDVSATLEGYVLLLLESRGETVLTCVGEDIWGITKSHFSPIQGLQIYMLYRTFVQSGKQRQ